MSETNTEAATTAADPTDLPPTVAVEDTPTWLPKRLEQAERSAIKKRLGVSEDEAKVILEAHAKAVEAEKTTQERLAQREQEVGELAKERERFAGVLSQYAESVMATLTDEQRAAVTAIAGEDSAKTLETVQALRPTWTNKPAPIQAGDSSAPTQGQPLETVGSDVPAETVLERYDRLQQENPFAAAAYHLLHFVAIEDARRTNK